jgi:hypothetical protein
MSEPLRGEWLRQIRQRLQYGLPPLTTEECRQLYFYATGDRIEQRKRCERCEGEGRAAIYGRIWTYFGECPECAGCGYKVRESAGL